MLEKIESPCVALASSEASKRSSFSLRRASSETFKRSVGKENSVSRVKSPVMISWLFTTAPVRPVRIRPNVLAPALTTRSPPISASASPVATRMALMSPGVFASRRWICTAPLCEAGHLHHASALAVDLRRLCQDRADGDDAGSANARDDHIPRAVNGG